MVRKDKALCIMTNTTAESASMIDDELFTSLIIKASSCLGG